MLNTALPVPVGTFAARLHRDGWSVGDMAIKRDGDGCAGVKFAMTFVSELVYPPNSSFSKIDEPPGNAADPRTSALGVDRRSPA
jgi:hypothetical protein